ncbi:hypothetical protein, conserved [Eimeria praecox]|uniref:RRM domain-containing protein n=1 Tax=Eimeria praecox TaxID=51316 RepID=U6H3T4_9EIME|nr:hypothetical protein, conserved [Eimeria praecox]
MPLDSSLARKTKVEGGRDADGETGDTSRLAYIPSDRPNTPHGRSVYVSNMLPGTSKETLRAAINYLLKHGEVVGVEMRERTNYLPYAFVELSSLQAAYELVQYKKAALVIGEQELKVQFKKIGLACPNHSLRSSSNSGALHEQETVSRSPVSLMSPFIPTGQTVRDVCRLVARKLSRDFNIPLQPPPSLYTASDHPEVFAMLQHEPSHPADAAAAFNPTAAAVQQHTQQTDTECNNRPSFSPFPIPVLQNTNQDTETSNDWQRDFKGFKETLRPYKQQQTVPHLPPPTASIPAVEPLQFLQQQQHLQQQQLHQQQLQQHNLHLPCLVETGTRGALSLQSHMETLSPQECILDDGKGRQTDNEMQRLSCGLGRQQEQQPSEGGLLSVLQGVREGSAAFAVGLRECSKTLGEKEEGECLFLLKRPTASCTDTAKSSGHPESLDKQGSRGMKGAEETPEETPEGTLVETPMEKPEGMPPPPVDPPIEIPSSGALLKLKSGLSSVGSPLLSVSAYMGKAAAAAAADAAAAAVAAAALQEPWGGLLGPQGTDNCSILLRGQSGDSSAITSTPSTSLSASLGCESLPSPSAANSLAPPPRRLSLARCRGLNTIGGGGERFAASRGGS